MASARNSRVDYFCSASPYVMEPSGSFLKMHDGDTDATDKWDFGWGRRGWRGCLPWSAPLLVLLSDPLYSSSIADVFHECRIVPSQQTVFHPILMSIV
jgi:hypothetical protein